MSDPAVPTPADPENTAADRAYRTIVTLRGLVRAALAVNMTYLDLATPTAAQTTAQVKALTRQVSALVRLIVAEDLLTDDPAT